VGKKCVSANDALDRAAQQQRKAYEDEAVIAVDGLIGRPTKLKLDLKRAKTKKQKKEAQTNYNFHKKLHDMLVEFLLETGEIGMSVGVIIDPHVKIRSFYNMLNDKFQFPITPTSIAAIRRPKSVYNYVKKIIDLNRDKKGISDFEKAWMPPSLVAAKADRFGMVDKVIRSALRLTDNTRQAYSEYQSELEAVRTGVSNNILAHIRSGAATVNNASMDGLHGFTDRDGKKLTITGEDADTYTVIYHDDVDGGRVKVSKNDVNANDDLIRDSLIEKYREELVNDLQHGQVRYIVPKGIPTKKSAKEKWLKSHDGKKVMQKINRLEFYGAKNLKSPDIRNISYKGVSYSYVLVKQGEESVGETYHAYITKIESSGSKPRSTVKTGYDVREFNEAMKEGFYKSDVHSSFGPILSKHNKFIEGSHDKRWRSFRRMSRQPNSSIMNQVAEVRADPQIIYNTLWEQLLTTRNVKKKMGIDMKSRIGDEQKTMSSLINSLRKSLKIHGNLSKESINDIITEIANLAGAESRVSIQKDGTIHSLNATFRTKGENYGPVKFHRRQMDFFVDKGISEMKERRLQMSAEMTADEKKSLDKDIKELEEYAMKLAGLNDNSSVEYINRLVFLSKAYHTKHRTLLTDHTLRRKDDRVNPDYMSETYRTLVRNDLISELVLTVEKMSRLNISPGLLEDEISYMLNRVKVAVGDPNTNAGWGRLRWGNQVIANKMNRLKEIAGLPQDWEPEHAEHMFVNMNAVMTMQLLGSRPALGNRTQTINDAITYGFPIMFKALQEYKTPYWQGIINNTGVLNLVSMFQDVMMLGQDIKWTDAGMVSHPLILVATAGFSKTLPTMNMIHWRKLWKLGRENFIKRNTNDKDIQKIYEWIGRRIKKEEIEGKEKEDLEYLASLYWDLLFATEKEQSKNPELVKARIKALSREVSESKLKRMVAWKLTKHFDPLKELFTFTEGEKANRSITVVASLLGADAMGALGSSKKMVKVLDFDGKEVPVEDRFLSDEAVNIARNAVYNTQFGMSQVYLGEAFGGAGRTGLQYKAYPLQQTIRDFNTWSNFFRGSNGVGDSIERLLREASGTLLEGYKVISGQPQFKYTPGKKGRDHEARAVLRNFLTRFLAGIFATITEVHPLLSHLARMAMGRSQFGMIRSMENPVAGIFMRLIAVSMVSQMDWDDDDTDKQIYDNIARLILPVIVSVAINWIISTKELEEEEKLGPDYYEDFNARSLMKR